LSAVIVAIVLASGVLASDENWPEFRGPTSDGHCASAHDLPTLWSESEHVKWKTSLPGTGWSSPVIWGNQIWTTTALDEGHSLHALCIDKQTGRIIHDVEVFHVDDPPHKHDFNSYASPTPAIEQGRVYICFGTNGSACLDTASAKPIWVNHELRVDHINGPGSSPILFQNLYLLCCDGGDFQYVAALYKETGKLAWRTDRSYDHSAMDPDNRKAYNTPLVVRNDGRDEIISIGAHRIYCYDVHSGEEIWYCDQPGFSNVSQPLFADGMAYISTGFGKADLWAIRADGTGDVSKTHVAWKYKKGTPCRSTPLLIGEAPNQRIFMVTDAGIAHYVKAEDGSPVWSKRIGTTFSASPLFADGRIWCFDEKGTGIVIKPADTPEVVAENQLGDGCMGTPAISGRALFVRTKTHLYRIEK
jgi:outer membrane protein assembly factor BamB